MSSAKEQGAKKGGKRERTRAALIAATVEIVAAKGFAAASLDEIAARAAMTKGAIYSNFSGRAELLIAAMGSRGLILSPVYAPGASLKTHLRAAAGALVAMLPKVKGEGRFMAEFQLYALGDPELRRGVVAGYGLAFANIADLLVEHHAGELAVAPRKLAVVLQSLVLGFVYQYLLTPDEVTDDVIVAAFDALADGVVKKAISGSD